MTKLSPAQELVYEQLLNGLNRNEIAEKLFITVHTVKDHVNEIYMRNNVHNLNQLYAKVIKDLKKQTSIEVYEKNLPYRKALEDILDFSLRCQKCCSAGDELYFKAIKKRINEVIK